MTRSTTRWPPHWEKGQRYDLSHVYPFKFDYVLPANAQFAERIVRIQVNLHLTRLRGNVKWTRRPTLTTARLARRACSITSGMGSRSGYRNSSATSATESASSRSTTTSSCSSCLRVPVDSEYWVFFFVERTDKREDHALNLIVQSAYVGKRERSPGGRLAKKITFRALLKGVGRRETKTAALKKQTPPEAGFVCRSS